MKYVYPVIFTEEDGKTLVEVPDLPGCCTFGDDLADAIDMARDAMSLWLCCAEDRNEEIPTATMNLTTENGFVSLVDVDTLAYRKETNNKAVKKTLSIPQWLNERALESNINFSQVLQNALMEQLNIR